MGWAGIHLTVESGSHQPAFQPMDWLTQWRGILDEKALAAVEQAGRENCSQMLSDLAAKMEAREIRNPSAFAYKEAEKAAKWAGIHLAVDSGGHKPAVQSMDWLMHWRG